jgi:pyruvate/2-oxoglutarate/acetoin dehydrogenase E1 component
LSEAAIAGIGLGASLTGLRPVAEIMFMDFLRLAMDQLVNQAAKTVFMSAGSLHAPLTIRTIHGGGRQTGPQHGQSLEVWLAHVPGLKVVWPSTPRDVKGLLTSAIRDDNPVVVIESLNLWTMRGEVPEGEFLIPIGEAEVKRAGNDVTIIAVGSVVHRALQAAELLDREGVSAEVIDLRTVSPLDRTTIMRSLEKTGRMVVTHDAVEPFGTGAEIAALAAGEGFPYLRAPVQRVAAPFTPVPFSPNLERSYFPQAEQIAAASLRALGEAAGRVRTPDLRGIR